MGKPAARITDMHICPKTNPGPVPHVGGPIVMGSPNVLIGNLPAARVGDMAVCVGPPDKVSAGSSGVLINGKQAARLGDSTAHGGKIVMGMPTVLVGGGGGGGGSTGGSTDTSVKSTVTAGSPVGAAAAVVSGAAAAPSSGAPGSSAPTPEDVELAKTPGNTPEQRAARTKVAKAFYKSEPSLGEKRFKQQVKGIDLSQPVEVVEFPPPDTMQQYVRETHQSPGNFFDPVGGQSADALGVSSEGRVSKTFKTPKGKGLMSTSAPIKDDWTNADNPVMCKGGGKQIIVGSDTKSKFKPV